MCEYMWLIICQLIQMYTFSFRFVLFIPASPLNTTYTVVLSLVTFNLLIILQCDLARLQNITRIITRGNMMHSLFLKPSSTDPFISSDFH